MADANDPSPLSHRRVLDLSQRLAGAYCTKLLAGFGAEVILVEPPQGTPLRHCSPFAQGEAGTERSLPFLWYATGKKSVTLDLTTAIGQDRLRQLVQTVDIVVTDIAPAELESLGLDEKTLHSLNPSLILTLISNFGQSGPYQDFEAEEITLYAMSGLMNGTGDPQRSPLAAGPAIAQLSAGLKAYIATLMACYRRTLTGRGDCVDLSIQEAALDNIEIAMAEYLQLKKVAKRNNDEHPLVPWRIFPCRDGYAAIIGGPIRHWLPGIHLFEEPRLSEPQYAHMEGRIKHRNDIRQLMAPWLMQHDRKEIFHLGQANKFAWGYVATLTDVFESPQNQARHFFRELEHPEIGKYSIAGAPFHPDKTSWQQRRSPFLGEHTDAILTELSQANPVKSFASPPNSETVSQLQPLSGIRIVDMTHDWAGPHATRIMADYGAEVIKVEYPARLDGMRGAYLERKNLHPRWWQMNRNKGSITLDLHLPEHVQGLKDLVQTADIVVDNSRPGVMERFGLGYDVLKSVCPDLIMVCMSAFGATGPESSYAGYGGCIEALSGVQSLTAYEQQGSPMRVRELDVTNGIMGACAIVTALLHRQQTGEGQFVDLSQREASTWLIGEHLFEFAINQTQTLPLGNRHPVYAPQNCYRCQGDDRWLVLTIRSDAEWQTFCEAIAHPEWLKDPRFGTVTDRMRHHDDLDQLIESWTLTQTAESAMQILQAQKLAAGAVANVSTLAQDEHLIARQWFQPAPEGDGSFYPGLPFRFAQGGGRLFRRGPDLGADNDAILVNLLHLPPAVLPSLADTDLGTAFDIE